MHKLTHLLLVVVVSFVSTSSAQQQPQPALDPFGMVATILEVGSDELVDNGDGTFSVVLDPEVGTEPPQWLNGVVEWMYVGQAKYKWDDDTQQPQRRQRIMLNPPTDTLTRLLMSEMEDQHGRLFVAKSADMDLLKEMIDAYNTRVAEEFGPEPVGSDNETEVRRHPRRAFVTPLTWYSDDQNGDGNDDRFRWNADGRRSVSEPLTSRQEKTLYMWRPTGTCSGVLIGDDWALTAAHCHKDGSGNWLYPRGVAMTRGGGWYSGSRVAGITARWGNGGYSGSGSVADDIVVVKLNGDLGESGNYMPMSNANRLIVQAHEAYNIGYPGRTPGGAANAAGASWFSTTYGALSPTRGMFRHNADADVLGTDIIATKIDCSTGHSGGPIFYFPWGLPNEYLTGLMVAHVSGATEYNGGRSSNTTGAGFSV